MSAARPDDATPAAPARVLVVEDGEALRQHIAECIADLGPEVAVDQAEDGVAALARIDAGHAYRLVVSDIIMPNLDGFQFLEIQAREPELQNIPVVIISARDSSQQPIMSRAIAVTQNSGIALPQLLACMSALSQILGVSDPVIHLRLKEEKREMAEAVEKKAAKLSRHG